MYQEIANFDQNRLHGEGLLHADDNFSQTHAPNGNGGADNNQSFAMDEHSSYPVFQQEAAAAALEMEFQHQLEIDQCYNNKNGDEIEQDPPNWQEINNTFNQFQHQIYANAPTGSFPAPDLLNMLPFPKSQLLPNSSSMKSPSFLASLGLLGEINPPSDAGSYDPLLPINLPPQTPMLRELFHSLPHGGFQFDERDYQNSDGIGNGVFEFNAADMDCVVGKSRDGKDVKHFATEKHRRVLLNDKFQSLRSLVPSPTKNDRASIVGDAINYIMELKRTVSELKVLVEKRRCAKERLKRPKTENDAMEGNESDHPHMNGSTFRSSWLLRKSKNTEVDVRIIDDQVTVKLVQQKRINCLLCVSKILDELQLDLHHVAGGLIGDYYSYLFNSKISEGSSVYASALANKLIEVVDKQYAAIASTSS